MSVTWAKINSQAKSFEGGQNRLFYRTLTTSQNYIEVY
jgi:hypothetical protein